MSTNQEVTTKLIESELYFLEIPQSKFTCSDEYATVPEWATIKLDTDLIKEAEKVLEQHPFFNSINIQLEDFQVNGDYEGTLDGYVCVRRYKSYMLELVNTYTNDVFSASIDLNDENAFKARLSVESGVEHPELNVSITPNGNLKIKLYECGKAEFEREMQKETNNIDYLMALYVAEKSAEYFGGQKVFLVSPESIGAMTEAPIFSDCESITDGDGREVGLDESSKVWWFPNYMIESFSAGLLENGEIIFSAAPENNPIEEKQQVNPSLWVIPVVLDRAGEKFNLQVPCSINNSAIMCGSGFKVGLVIQDTGDFEDSSIICESICLSYNEGQEASSTFEFEATREEGKRTYSWTIPQFIIDMVEFDHETFKEGSKIVTEDGYTLILVDGEWTDGDLKFSSIYDIESDYRVYPKL